MGGEGAAELKAQKAQATQLLRDSMGRRQGGGRSTGRTHGSHLGRGMAQGGMQCGTEGKKKVVVGEARSPEAQEGEEGTRAKQQKQKEQSRLAESGAADLHAAS